jgi:hypothetical protein
MKQMSALRARLETEARQLAHSGQYRNSAAIERELLARGYPNIERFFANRWTQSELDRLCRQAELFQKTGNLRPSRT